MTESAPPPPSTESAPNGGGHHDTLAVIGLVFAILAILIGVLFIPIVGILLSVVAIAFGVAGRASKVGKWSLWLGAIALVITIVWIVYAAHHKKVEQQCTGSGNNHTCTTKIVNK